MGAPEAVPEAPRILSAEQILKANDKEGPVQVDVPEWGGVLFIRVMPGHDRDRYELIAEEGIKNKTQANIRATLLSYTLCDASGKLLFGHNAITQLGAKSSIVIDRLFIIAKKHNKLADADIEELEKKA